MGQGIEKTAQMELVGPAGAGGENLAPYTIGTIKVRNVNNTMNYEFVPWTPCSDSVFVYIAWDQQPNVDLHVVENGLTNVWNNSRIGTYGNLTYGSSVSYGPEQYETQCGQIFDNATVYLKYVNGTNNEDGTLQPTRVAVIIRINDEWFFKAV